MSSHLLRDLEQVKKKVLAMGGLVEEATHQAITAVLTRRPELAQEVLEGDDRVDRMELELEEDCLKILALHQPVAGDLRYVISIMKVNNDLERVGDLASNIAARASEMGGRRLPEGAQELKSMAEKVRTMLRLSLDALVQQDPGLAREVCALDEAVDELHRQRFRQIQQLIRESPDNVELAIELLSVSRYLERIADHATNIAEDVVFMVEGEIIRHQKLGRR